MSDYLGDIAVGATVRAWLDTEDASGAAVTLGSPAAHALKDGSGSQITSGITIDTDVDGTGIHRVNINTSAMTAGEYAIVATGTVSGVSISRLVTQLSIANRSLSAAAVQAIWDALTSALTTSGSIGKWILDKLDVVLSTRLATSSYTAPDNTSSAAAASAAASAAISSASAATLAGLLQARVPASPAAVGDIPTAAQNAAAYMDLADGVEVGLTPRQCQRLMVAALAGKLSGAATTTIVIRNAVADSKDRITATVDTDGNRSAITVDLS